MITYTTNQRRSLRFTGTDWTEEVLSASGSAVDETNFSAISGANVQLALDAIDNVIGGLQVPPASGIVFITDVANVSGVVGGTLQNLDVVTMGSGSASTFRFSFGVPAQPVAPINLRVLVSARGASASGTLSGNLSYNIFDQGDDLTNGAYTYTQSVSQSLNAGDFEKLKVINIPLTLSNFSSGSAPFIVDCSFTRVVSGGGNYTNDVSVVGLYADNVPGGLTGNTAGYIGGNLDVTGDLTVSGLLIVQGGSAPASGTAPGVSGTLIISDDFIYTAVSANSWKRTPLGIF